MKRAHTLSFVITMMLVAGCSASPPARFYVLSATAVTQSGPTSNARVMVGPVSIPASVDQPQFVLKVASNRVEVDELDRWAAPLDESIARAVAGDLAILLGTPTVATAQLANFSPEYVVAIDVQRFESVKGDSANLEAVWTVRKISSGEILSGRSSIREPALGKDYEALAVAHSRALAGLSENIADVIRAENSSKKQT